MGLPAKKTPLSFEIHTDVANELFQRLRGDVNGFKQISVILRDIAGINLPLNDKNLCLVASRLSTVLKEKGIEDYTSYIEFLNRSGADAIDEFVSQMTTNTTQFFREKTHFDFLARQFPQILQKARQAGRNDIRIWCSASSTGQEPYTIAITVAEAFAAGVFCDVKILATDIDRSVLEKASRGVYSAAEIESLPAGFKHKYFDAMGKSGNFRAKSMLRNLLEFSEFNLTAEKYPFTDHFDVVFCRNVLIYFEPKTAQSVVERLSQSLRPGGYLLLGHSESGSARLQTLQAVGPSVYQRGERP